MDPLDTIFDAPQAEPVAKRASELQLAIYDAVKDFTKPLLVRARAGTGKTTTLIDALEQAPGSSLAVAFNKDAASELKSRIPLGSDAQARTLNSLGHGLFWRYRRSAKLDFQKVRKIVHGLITDSEWRREYGYAVERTVSLMKANAFGINQTVDQHEIADLISSYDLNVPFERLEWASEMALRAFDKSIFDTATFDFDDQVYIPIKENWAFPSFSNVFIDEAQDLNAIQHMVLERLCIFGARPIAFGDDRQSIYGFRGALSNSLELLKEKFSMSELPLNISYRCARSVIAEAQVLCPDIQPRPDAPEGQVHYIRSEFDQRDPEFFGDCLVLSRNNAPLFRAILRYIRSKTPCRVRSNFLESFQGFINSFKVHSTAELLPLLDKWYESECNAANKKGFKGKLLSLQDKYETTKLLASEFETCIEMTEAVKRLGESTQGTIFSTIHRAKGSEHDRVYLLRPDTIPSIFATTPEAIQQEFNALYVAITRAKLEFTFGERAF